ARRLRGEDRLDTRDVPADFLYARGFFELTGCLLKAQVKLLLLQCGKVVVQLIGRPGPHIGGFHECRPSLLCDTLYEARLDRELSGAEAQRFARDFLADAVDLEHHPARLDPGGPEVDGPFALAHTNLGRLRRDRNIRKHADPDT